MYIERPEVSTCMHRQSWAGCSIDFRSWRWSVCPSVTQRNPITGSANLDSMKRLAPMVRVGCLLRFAFLVFEFLPFRLCFLLVFVYVFTTEQAWCIISLTLSWGRLFCKNELHLESFCSVCLSPCDGRLRKASEARIDLDVGDWRPERTASRGD